MCVSTYIDIAIYFLSSVPFSPSNDFGAKCFRIQFKFIDNRLQFASFKLTSLNKQYHRKMGKKISFDINKSKVFANSQLVVLCCSLIHMDDFENNSWTFPMKHEINDIRRVHFTLNTITHYCFCARAVRCAWWCFSNDLLLYWLCHFGDVVDCEMWMTANSISRVNNLYRHIIPPISHRFATLRWGMCAFILEDFEISEITTWHMYDCIHFRYHV